ncbi:hypothetical protein STW0522PSE72_33170 [Pseudomonas monteilii]|nr:hypothetical protein STW0522PSE72_33170 [Pseudomonas monteilii]
MPTENRSSNTEMVSVPPYIGLEPLVGRYYPAQCRRCGWVGSSEELTEDDAQCTFGWVSMAIRRARPTPQASALVIDSPGRESKASSWIANPFGEYTPMNICVVPVRDNRT